MKTLTLFLSMLAAGAAAAQTMAPMTMPVAAPVANERLGTVSFPVSCPTSQVAFNRGVALLHDFWYDEAERQFKLLVQSDPHCAMAHWGLAMSVFHQIWGRPDAESRKLGWAQMKKAESTKPQTGRERAYIDALAAFFKPGPADYPVRIAAYDAAMQKLYAAYPDDVDAGAFYALSLLADEKPDDTSLTQERKAMVVLKPLFVKYPDNPGVVHYIVHACDNPALASEGLAAADHYLEIAQSGPHAYHMPGHIYARLGMWPQDIASQLGSIEASKVAEAHGEHGVGDEPHSYDFLLYAYLQSGQDAQAKATLAASADPLRMIGEMPSMGMGHRGNMIPYYRVKLPAFYALERRDWATAAAMEPVADSSPAVKMMVDWARAEAHGRLKQAAPAEEDLARHDALLEAEKKGPDAYQAQGTGIRIERGEMVGWVAFAAGRQAEALQAMREAADLQDKVGQGEVDIPAREMLADMLLEFGQPQQALAEYEVALKLSPNRLNGLYNAGRAAEAAGDATKARLYYATLMKTTGNGEGSSRPEFAHARSFLRDPQASGQ